MKKKNFFLKTTLAVSVCEQHFRILIAKVGNVVACIVLLVIKKHSIPSSNGQREIMHVIQRFDG